MFELSFLVIGQRGTGFAFYNFTFGWEQQTNIEKIGNCIFDTVISVTLSVDDRVEELEDDWIELTELLRVVNAAAELSELRPKGSVGGGTMNLAGRDSIVERWLRLRSGSLPTEESSESSAPSERRLLSRLARITGTSVRRTE